jgi:hypothetical protein
MLCHGALAADRPSPSLLTSFYLVVAAGGVLGGLFAALAATPPVRLGGRVSDRARRRRGRARGAGCDRTAGWRSICWRLLR